jgi:transcriptional regulator with XRE-family HTH domain
MIVHATEGYAVLIGERLRALREEKKLSQGDIQEKTGLSRNYVSCVENGHTVPAVETLEKFARALEVPIYQLFYDGEKPPKLSNLSKHQTAKDDLWGSSGKDARMLHQFCQLFGKMEKENIELMLFTASNMIKKKPLRGVRRRAK